MVFFRERDKILVENHKTVGKAKPILRKSWTCPPTTHSTNCNKTAGTAMKNYKQQCNGVTQKWTYKLTTKESGTKSQRPHIGKSTLSWAVLGKLYSCIYIDKKQVLFPLSLTMHQANSKGIKYMTQTRKLARKKGEIPEHRIFFLSEDLFEYDLRGPVSHVYLWYPQLTKEP